MKLLAKNLLILASAGSGKTYQLGNRVIGLVARGGAPERIVALTFTRKAAGEFADSVLSKLAAAAADDEVAARLRGDLELPAADFADALERVVRALPSFTLGTMDSFFARIVRGFQYELGLTGGRFDLLEGPRAAAATDELLAGVLGGAFLSGEDGEEFFHAFRRATIGREDQGVLVPLRGFIGGWQEVYRADHALEWGPENLAGARPDDWPKHRAALAEAVMQGMDAIVFTDKRQREALEKAVRGFGGALHRQRQPVGEIRHEGRHLRRGGGRRTTADAEVLQGVHHRWTRRRGAAPDGRIGGPLRVRGGLAADARRARGGGGLRCGLRAAAAQERHAAVQRCETADGRVGARRGRAAAARGGGLPARRPHRPLAARRVPGHQPRRLGRTAAAHRRGGDRR